MLSYTYRNFEADSNHLYDYLQALKQVEPDSEYIVEHFRSLFIESIDYPEPRVLAALHRLVKSQWAGPEFRHVLNRCCYIFINAWWSQGNHRAIYRLAALFQEPAVLPTSSPVVERLRRLVKHFTHTPQYSILQHHAQMNPGIQSQGKVQLKMLEYREIAGDRTSILSSKLNSYSSQELTLLERKQRSGLLLSRGVLSRPSWVARLYQ